MHMAVCEDCLHLVLSLSKTDNNTGFTAKRCSTVC